MIWPMKSKWRRPKERQRETLTRRDVPRGTDDSHSLNLTMAMSKGGWLCLCPQMDRLVKNGRLSTSNRGQRGWGLKLGHLVANYTQGLVANYTQGSKWHPSEKHLVNLNKGQIDTSCSSCDGPCMFDVTGEDEAFAESSIINSKGVTKLGSDPEDNNYLTKDGPRSWEVKSLETITQIT